MFSTPFTHLPQQASNVFSFNCGSHVIHPQSTRPLYKQPSRRMQHTNRNLKVQSAVARNRAQRDMKIFEKRGGSEELERIMDIMERRNKDLQQAREAKLFIASQYAPLAEDEFEDEGCCSILPVEHAIKMERERLREMEERQREIEAMEAEIEEYARLADEEELRIRIEEENAHSIRQEQHMVMCDAREPWDESDEDIAMSG